MSGALELGRKPSGPSWPDTRCGGKLASFNAAHERSSRRPFSAWQRLLQHYVMWTFSDRMEPREWTHISEDDMDNVHDEPATVGDQVRDLQDKVHQLHLVLVEVPEVQADDIVCNISTNDLEG